MPGLQPLTHPRRDLQKFRRLPDIERPFAWQSGASVTTVVASAGYPASSRNGDVITGVNDQSIASVEDAMKVFGTLSTDAPIQVKIKRRGREETLEYKIE